MPGGRVGIRHRNGRRRIERYGANGRRHLGKRQAFVLGSAGLSPREGNCRVAVCRISGENRSLTPQQLEWRLHGTTLKGTLGDISLNGAAVLLKDPLPIGENLVLRLFCPRRDRHLDQQAFVLRNLPEDGESKVICQFTNRLSLEQVSYYSRFLNESGWL